MRKVQILKMLEEFADDDHIAFDDVLFLGDPKRICGKGQYAMPYICVLKPDHDGDCYCGCKHVDFEPENKEEIAALMQHEPIEERGVLAIKETKKETTSSDYCDNCGMIFYNCLCGHEDL